jgi:hypothetical protein
MDGPERQMMEGRQLVLVPKVFLPVPVPVSVPDSAKSYRKVHKKARLPACRKASAKPSEEALIWHPSLEFSHEKGMKRPGFRGGSNTGEWSHEEVPEVFA